MGGIGDSLQGDLGEVAQKEEEATEFGSEGAGTQIQSPHIGDVSFLHQWLLGTFIVGSARKAGKPLFLENLRDRDGAEAIAFLRKHTLHIVN
jgi:hypothetical protein